MDKVTKQNKYSTSSFPYPAFMGRDTPAVPGEESVVRNRQ